MRPRRPDYIPGQYYHIYNRGAHGVSIFREDDNYIFVLRNDEEVLRSVLPELDRVLLDAQPLPLFGAPGWGRTSGLTTTAGFQ